MKATSVAFKAHLALEVTTLCTCWQITRRDGQSFYFTDHDSDLLISGSTYISAVGYKRTALSADPSLAIDNLEVTGIFDSDTLVADDLRSGMFDFAEVHIFQVNWDILSQGIMRLRRGYLGEITMLPSGIFQGELRGLLQRLTTKVGEVYSDECRADLGDARCKVDLAPVTGFETVLAVTDSRVFQTTNSLVAFAGPGWYNGGVLTWTSGNNNGRSMEVKDWDFTQTVTLFLPMPRPVVVGDTLRMTPGCNKTLIHCRDKFNNVVNRRAEDYIPGIDAILQTPTPKPSSGGKSGKKGGIA